MRIIQKKYYGDSQEKMEKGIFKIFSIYLTIFSALQEFQENGCTFLVAGNK